MFNPLNLISKFIKSSNQKELDRISKIVEKINLILISYSRFRSSQKNGGEGGIRTHGTLARSPVFKTGAYDHSATSPLTRILHLFINL